DRMQSQVISYIRDGCLSTFQFHLRGKTFKPIAMYKNYLKIAVRFLSKNKAYSFINIVGLSIGTLCCLYILLYVKDQYSYDKHHRDANNIYRINSLLKIGGDKHNNATASPPIAPAIKKDFGEVLEYTRLVTSIGLKQHLLHYKEKSFYETNAVYVD